MDNVDKVHEEIKWEGVDWLAQNSDRSLAVVKKVMNLRIFKI